MSKKENPSLNGAVTERLCLARQNALKQEIRSIKLVVYAVGATITIVVTIVQIVLKLFLG